MLIVESECRVWAEELGEGNNGCSNSTIVRVIIILYIDQRGI